jgi:hypothetical protein
MFLPSNIYFAMVCKQVHHCDGGATFLQSTFQAAFFIPNPTAVSDKTLDCITFKSEFIMHNVLMIKNHSALLSLTSISIVFS